MSKADFEEANQNGRYSRLDNYVDAHPEEFPDNEIIDALKEKKMDFGDNDPDQDNKLQEALGK